MDRHHKGRKGERERERKELMREKQRGLER